MVPDAHESTANEVAPAEPDASERTESALRRLLEVVHAGPPPGQFYREVLDCIAGAMEAPHATLEVRLPAETIQHEIAQSSERPDFWRRNLQKHLADTLAAGRPRARLFDSAKLQRSIAFLGVPLLDSDGRGIGALALVVACRDTQEVRELLTFLHCTSLVAAYTGTPPAPDAPAAQPGGGPSGAKLLERLAAFSSPTELAFEITNKIRNRASCIQVALGRVKGKSLRLLSISGLDDYKKRSPQVLALQAAMEECLDLGAPIVSQDPGQGGGDPARHLLHEQWRKVAGGSSAVASIPLALEDGNGAILSMRRAQDQRFSESEIQELGALVAPYVAGMTFVERANQGLARHALARLGHALGGWSQPRRWLGKAAYALPAALALFLAFGSLPHRVSVPCALVPRMVHNVSAPFDAVLRSSIHVAGDHVNKGELLASFDTTELELERGELLSEMQIVLLKHRAALANGAAVERALLDAQRGQLLARIEVIERELERSAVRAPFDGIILTGDLHDRVGDQVVRGEPLFRVSPTRDWKLELDVPETSVVHLREGQAGRFSSRARPEDSHEFTIRRIRPSAEQRNGATVYVTEADIAFRVDWLLAGMEGLARIETAKRPAWWVVFHGALDRLRLSFWL